MAPSPPLVKGRGARSNATSRFIAADWDTTLPGPQAAEKAQVPIAWLGIARMPIEPG